MFEHLITILKSLVIMIIFIIILSFILATCIGLFFLTQPVLVNGSSKLTNDLAKPPILLTCLVKGLGGGEVHVLVFHKMLTQHGYASLLLVPAHSKLNDYLTQHQIPHYTTYINKFISIRPLYNFLLGWYLHALCKKENINIIQCNNYPEVAAALTTKKYHPATRVVLTRHVVNSFSIHKIKDIDAIIAVSPATLTYLESENLKRNLNIGAIRYIPPFFNADRLRSYAAIEHRQDFFKRNFGITVNHDPVICMIANFVRDLMCKNHPLLFQAIKILVHKNKLIHVMLAGDGVSREYLQNLAHELGISHYVSFLGFTDNIPGLLYHSDIFVLSSSNEASPLVYRESGLMRKPAIGATGTGAEAIILHEKTGLLFKNNNAVDLADQIERLIDNPNWASELGSNAHEHIKSNFSPEASFAMYEKMYQALQVPGPR